MFALRLKCACAWHQFSQGWSFHKLPVFLSEKTQILNTVAEFIFQVPRISQIHPLIINCEKCLCFLTEIYNVWLDLWHHPPAKKTKNPVILMSTHWIKKNLCGSNEGSQRNNCRELWRPLMSVLTASRCVQCPHSLRAPSWISLFTQWNQEATFTNSTAVSSFLVKLWWK